MCDWLVKEWIWFYFVHLFLHYRHLIFVIHKMKEMWDANRMEMVWSSLYKNNDKGWYLVGFWHAKVYVINAWKWYETTKVHVVFVEDSICCLRMKYRLNIALLFITYIVIVELIDSFWFIILQWKQLIFFYMFLLHYHIMDSILNLGVWPEPFSF